MKSFLKKSAVISLIALFSFFLASCWGDNESPGFKLQLADIELTAGESTSATVSIVRTDFTNEVALSVSGTPSFLTASFDEASTLANQVTLTLTAEDTAEGTHSLTLMGTAGRQIKTKSFTVNVLAPSEPDPTEPDPTEPDPIEPDPTEPRENKANYNAYSGSLPSWSSFSPALPDERRPTGASQTVQELLGDVTYDCTTTPYSLTSTPEEIVTLEPDAGVFWVGGLLQGKGYKEGIGSLKELPIRERAPVVVSIDILSGNNTLTVENPTAARVNQAIGELIEKATTKGLKAGSSIFYEQESTHSLEQSALDLGMSVSFLGASIKSRMGYSQKADESTITAYFVQKMFTVSTNVPATPEAVFSDAFTQDKLDRQISLGNIGRDNIPTYVSSITYGRIMSFTFTSSASETDVRAALSAAYSGQEADLTFERKKILQEAKVQLVTVGGEASNALAAIRSGNVKDYFDPDAALTSAKPISYVVRNLGDNSIAKVSETTTYNIKECSARAAEKKGERIRITIEKIKVISDCDRGINPAGDMIGKLWINDELVWNLPETEYNDGEDIPINVSVTKDYFFDTPEQIKIGGFLTDVDTGDDQRVGLWIDYHDPLDPETKRSYIQNSRPDCESDLYYSIEKVDDLF